MFAAGNDAVVIISVGSTVTVYDCVALTAGVSLSDAFTVKVTTPAVVGVPEITPAATDIPAGSDPVEMEYVYGARPPDAVTVVEYANPTSAFGSEDGASVTVPALTVKVSVTVALSCAAAPSGNNARNINVYNHLRSLICSLSNLNLCCCGI